MTIIAQSLAYHRDHDDSAVDATPKRTMTHVQLRLVMCAGYAVLCTGLEDVETTLSTLINMSSYTKVTCQTPKPCIFWTRIRLFMFSSSLSPSVS